MSEASPHEAAVEAFVDRVNDAQIPAVERLILFGSVAKQSHSEDSDVDVLAVIENGADVAVVEEQLRDVAYDVMLEYGPVFSIHAVTVASFENRTGHPFFQHVDTEGRAIYG